MAAGPEGHPTPEQETGWAQKCAEHRARAALVTGPRKIFNDAALAVEKISADVERYWRSASARDDTKRPEAGFLPGVKSMIGNLIFKQPEICGNSGITADIAALEELMKGLPGEGGELCRIAIEKTRQHIRTEKDVYALRREAEAVHSPYRLDVGVVLQKAGFGLAS